MEHYDNRLVFRLRADGCNRNAASRLAFFLHLCFDKTKKQAATLLNRPISRIISKLKYPQSRHASNNLLPDSKFVLERKIHIGDCVDFMKNKMQPSSVALTVTSPPYDNLRDYHGYKFRFEDIAQGLFRVTKKGGVVVWVVGDKIVKGSKTMTSFRQGLFFQEIGFQVHDVMIYQKKNTPFMRSNAYTNCYEFMFVLTKGSPQTFTPLKVSTARNGYEMLTHNKMADGINKKVLKELKKEKTKVNIWQYAVGLGGTTSDKLAFKHPAVFPEQLARDHILSWTKKGDIVFDPMCGSGTTCKVAMLNERSWIGVDISEEYVEIARRRIGLARQKNVEDKTSVVNDAYYARHTRREAVA